MVIVAAITKKCLSVCLVDVTELSKWVSAAVSFRPGSLHSYQHSQEIKSGVDELSAEVSVTSSSFVSKSYISFSVVWVITRRGVV